jgi:hypothetical protein
MWGVSTEDESNIAVSRSSSLLKRFLPFFKKKPTPQENILVELGNVRSILERELLFLENPSIDEAEKRKRMTYLFVKDLLDGVNGMILDHKDRRDNATKKSASFSAKVTAAVFILLVCLGMLFYLFLFSIRQTVTAQNAWFNSFLLWLFFEIALISTGVVLVEHVIIPMWSMRAVSGVKQKIVWVR